MEPQWLGTKKDLVPADGKRMKCHEFSFQVGPAKKTVICTVPISEITPVSHQKKTVICRVPIRDITPVSHL